MSNADKTFTNCTRTQFQRTGALGLLALACLTAVASADKISPLEPATAVLPLMKKAPAVDGAISEDEWADAVRIVGMGDLLGGGALHPRMATCWFGSDGKRIYAAVRSELPPVGELSARVRKKDGAVWYDDSIEIWLAPHRSKKPDDQTYIQMIGNPIGTVFDVAHVPGGAQAPWDGDWEFKNSTGDGWWSSEASVSLESLGVTADDLKQEWRVHVCRSWQQPSVYTSWAPMTGGFANRDTMVRVRWDDSAPVVQMETLGKDAFEGKVDVAVAVRNPTSNPMEVKVRLELLPAFFQLITEEQTLKLAPGTKETVHIGGNMDPRQHAARIRVTSPDGSKLYFARSLGWDKRPKVVWRVGEQEAKAVDFNVAYYPYLKKLRANLDLSGLTAWEAVKKASIIVTREGETKPLAKSELTSFKNKRGETVVETPDLTTGTYVATLKLDGGPGVPSEAFQQKCKRKVFEWEHNKLGTSRVIVPPFTPIEVKGRDVSTILRTHTMNDFGLWDQVNATGESILAGPIRLEAHLNKDASSEASYFKWKHGKLRFVEKSKDRVRTQASLASPTLKAQVNSEFDYDGMMKVELELTPQETGEIESLTLSIPVKSDIATLMHACVDGVLANPAGAIPAGEGVVWDSTKTQRSNTYGTWIPYLWIGGPERGVCFFSDTDRDWVLDDNKVAIDLVRKDGAVTLRAHLINRPAKLTRKHRIVFGLQATPVKPLPADWRKWALLGGTSNTVNFAFLWSGTVWGGWDDFHSLYPRNHDYTVWEKLGEAKRTGKKDWEFARAWQKKGEEMNQNNANAIQLGMHLMQPGVKAILYIDPRNGCVGGENEYFAADGFTMEPTPTWRDCATWYVNKMFDYGVADGVFLDEVYLRANFDTVSGSAYVRPDGNIQPSMGLWSLRAFSKRLAVLCHERGMRNYTFDHMTTCNVVPARAFSIGGIDWEAAYGAAPFQTRFSPDNIRAQTIGLHTGQVRAGLGGIVTEDEKEKVRLSRTQLGVAQVHEIKVAPDGRTVGGGELNNRLYDFGYGEPDCKVYTYWNGPQPVTVEGPKNLSLVLSRAGKALVFVTDYSGTGGECSLAVDKKALGLKNGLIAKDAETGESLPASDGKVRFPIKQHDFRMVVIE